jgi:hypothetical protein
MTKRARPKPKRPPGKRFIMLEFWELECPAFTHLSADATRVYLFMRKAMSFDTSNNGMVAFSHATPPRYCIPIGAGAQMPWPSCNTTASSRRAAVASLELQSAERASGS